MGWGTKLCVFLACVAPQRPCVGFKLPFRKNEAAANGALSSPKQEHERYKVLLTSAKVALLATAAVGSVTGVSAAAAGVHVMARVALHGAQVVSVGLPFLLRNVEDVKEAAQEPASASALKGGELVLHQPLRFVGAVDGGEGAASAIGQRGEAPPGGELVLHQPLRFAGAIDGGGAVSATCAARERDGNVPVRVHISVLGWIPLPVASLSPLWSIPASLVVLLSVLIIVRGTSKRATARAAAARAAGRVTIRRGGQRRAGRGGHSAILLSLNLDNEDETWTRLMAVHRWILSRGGTVPHSQGPSRGHVFGDLHVEATSSGSTDVGRWLTFFLSDTVRTILEEAFASTTVSWAHVGFRRSDLVPTARQRQGHQAGPTETDMGPGYGGARKCLLECAQA